MQKFIIILLTFSTLLISTIFSQHFVVDLEPNGTSQLTILSESITALEVGDEIGIFDENAITNYNDCTNQVGELLVGAGVWDGTQLNLVSVGAVDRHYLVDWNATDYASGVYFVKMVAGSYVNTQKLMLVK